MASNLHECTVDAIHNLSESHKKMHDVFLGELAIAEGQTDHDAKMAAVHKAKDGLQNGYRIAEEAYQAEVEACKATYPS
jgi:hypothetical protein